LFPLRHKATCKRFNEGSPIESASDLYIVEQKTLPESRIMLTRRSRLKCLEVMRDGFVGCLIVVMLALPNNVDSVLAGQTAEALSAFFYTVGLKYGSCQSPQWKQRKPHRKELRPGSLPKKLFLLKMNDLADHADGSGDMHQDIWINLESCISMH
jgi:hypothetical protein